MIILFHRPPFAPDPETKVETPGTTTGVKHSDTFAVQSLKFSEEDGALKIHIDVILKRKHTLSLDSSLTEGRVPWWSSSMTRAAGARLRGTTSSSIRTPRPEAWARGCSCLSDASTSRKGGCSLNSRFTYT